MLVDMGDPRQLFQFGYNLQPGFRERDRMMDECLNQLKVADTEYVRADRKVVYEGAKGILVEQVRLAVPRTNLPFKYRLTEPPGSSPNLREKIGLTERMMEGALDTAFRARQASAHHPGPWDWCSFAITRGAICVFPYWDRKDDNTLVPRLEVYDPRYVYYAVSDDEIAWLFYFNTLKQADAAAYADSKGWKHEYDPQSTLPVDMVTCWWKGHDGGVYWSVVGRTHVDGGDVYNFDFIQSPTLSPQYKQIPVIYVPCGGESVVSERAGTPPLIGIASSHKTSYSLSFGQTHYGRPYIADMITHIKTINILREAQVYATMWAATPPGVIKSPDGTATAELVPGELTQMDEETSVELIQQTSAYLSAVETEIAAHHYIIYGLGMNPATIGLNPMFRSELLRAGSEQSNELNLVPYREGHQTTAEWIGDQYRFQLKYWLTDGGIKSVSFAIPVSGGGKKERPQLREFTADDLYWDGLVSADMGKLPQTQAAIQNAQVFIGLSSLKDSPLTDDFLLTEVMQIDDPEIMLRRKIEERRDRAIQPAMDLVLVEHWLDALSKIAAKIGAHPPQSLDPREMDFLASVIGRTTLDAHIDVKAITVKDVDTIIRVVTNLVGRMRQALIPPPNPVGASPEPPGGLPAGTAPTQMNPNVPLGMGGPGMGGAEAAQLAAQMGREASPGH